MQRRTSIILSIVLTLTTLWFFQILLFQALTATFHAVTALQTPYYWVVTGYHLFLMLLLCCIRDYFRYSDTGQRLWHINPTNKLTMIRLSSMPTAGFLVYLSNSHRALIPVLTAYITFLFLTDLADGFLSRKTGQVTEMGKMMDSASDYLLLAVIAVVFLITEVIPLWFFVLLFVRFALQTAGMTLLWGIRRSAQPESTLIGKAFIFYTMSLFALELAAMLPLRVSFPDRLLQGLEYLGGAVILLSLADKIHFQASALRRALRERSSGNEDRDTKQS